MRRLHLSKGMRRNSSFSRNEESRCDFLYVYSRCIVTVMLCMKKRKDHDNKHKRWRRRRRQCSQNYRLWEKNARNYHDINLLAWNLIVCNVLWEFFVHESGSKSIIVRQIDGTYRVIAQFFDFGWSTARARKNSTKASSRLMYPIRLNPSEQANNFTINNWYDIGCRNNALKKQIHNQQNQLTCYITSLQS